MDFIEYNIMDLDNHVYSSNNEYSYRKSNHKNPTKWKFMWISTNRGRGLGIDILDCFVIFSLRIYSSLSKNINGVLHMIYLCCLIQILHCSLCMYPTTHEPSTGVTARSNYVIISIYLPHDPGRKMKRNHETLKQLIANN